jgi:chemotaxis signal transduction protein
MTNNVAYKTGEALQVLSFEVGTQTYCVPVNSVREIRGVTPPTQLPDAPPYVRGVINLRGQVMPVIDLSARLGKGVAEDGPRQVIIMKAAVLREVGKPLQIEDVQINKPGPHEVLIRTAAAGVCHSDLHFIEGSYPHPLPAVLGHESAGVVEAVGSEVRTVKPGDHVITCLSAFCGHCEHCLTGHMSLCVSPDTKRGPDDEPRLTSTNGADDAVPEPVVLRRADADPRARLRGDPQGHAAGPRRPDRLLGDDRRRRGDPHLQRPAGRHRGGDRLRRRRPGGDQRRGDRRRRPDHRHRHGAG